MMGLLAAGSPLDHVVAHNIGFKVFGYDVNNFMLMQTAAFVFLILVIIVAFRRYAQAQTAQLETLVPTGMTNLLEALCAFIRDQVARPVLAEHTDRFMPYVWTAFFYVLFCNLFGLIPVDAFTAFFGMKTHLAGTATGCIYVTATLALCTMLMMIVNGLFIGGKHYLAHFCPGPLVLAPLLVPVEILGLAAKIFALAVRLFANMLAGHVLLAVLIGFTASGFAIAVPAAAGAAMITCLEIGVAFLQAYIFTFLTCLFIGQSVVFHHDDHH